MLRHRFRKPPFCLVRGKNVHTKTREYRTARRICVARVFNHPSQPYSFHISDAYMKGETLVTGLYPFLNNISTLINTLYIVLYHYYEYYYYKLYLQAPGIKSLSSIQVVNPIPSRPGSKVFTTNFLSTSLLVL